MKIIPITMKNAIVTAVFVLLTTGIGFTQVSINNDSSTPDPSAGLDVKFTNKGVLVPRMTQAQISLIANPADGLLVFCSTDDKFYAYTVSTGTWREIQYGSGIIQTCSGSLTVNHVAGTVAPVTKTVIYGVVNNVPGETSKCWITSNLGADHQATSLADATEASAGWYWQFNRKQGYRHDGATLTPAWNTSGYAASSNWTSDQDPCTIELGGIWRIPTYSEWLNVDASGGWTDWNGPWNSLLKLHAAGYLYYATGSLTERGTSGNYFSSTESAVANGWYLYFPNWNSFVTNNYKRYGYSIRCIKG